MKKKITTFILLVMVSFMLLPTFTWAETPYKTYTIDGYGWVLETQSAYTPMTAITKVGETSFVNPMDMVISQDDTLYIADAGAHVIIVCDLEGNPIRTIGEGILKSPTGVYVNQKNMVYVADKDAKKVFVFDQTGSLLAEYGKPDSPIYGNSMDFKPTKIVANETGTMYIICEGNMNGIVQLSPVEGGSFLGYFGTNLTALSPFAMLQRVILTDAQRAQMLSNIPSTPTNLSIDTNGLIYTVTQGDQELSLKKLNIAGKNLFELEDYWADLPVAVTTGNYNNILVADTNGYIFEYTEEGELLLVFGGRDDGRQRIGLCNKVEAIAVDKQDRIYTLDSDKKQIHVFEPTEFTDLLHESMYLYSKGKYEESKVPLAKVLNMNSMFRYANEAMGKAYLHGEDYETALNYFKVAKDFTGYSDAFWEVRNIWIRNYLVMAVGVIVLIIIAFKTGKYIARKKKIKEPELIANIKNTKLGARLRFGVYYMKHPLDGCYGVKREGKASYLCANLILGGFIILSIIDKYFCGFLMKTVREGRYDLATDIGSVLIIFIGLTLCNYLVVTINDGEGFFKQLYCGYAYCLTPFIVIKPIAIILSNVLTYNEVFLIDFANIIIWTWIVVLILLTVKEMNNYSVKDTVKTLFITAFTVLILALLICIIYVLFSQAIDFVVTVVREVVYRIGN